MFNLLISISLNHTYYAPYILPLPLSPVGHSIYHQFPSLFHFLFSYTFLNILYIFKFNLVIHYISIYLIILPLAFSTTRIHKGFSPGVSSAGGWWLVVRTAVEISVKIRYLQGIGFEFSGLFLLLDTPYIHY